MLVKSEILVDWTEHHLQEYKESALMFLVVHLIGQPSLDISPMWTTIIEEEVRKLQLRPV
jgi:hypothetical protein